MSEHINRAASAAPETDVLLPEGWTEDEDLFAGADEADGGARSGEETASVPTADGPAEGLPPQQDAESSVPTADGAAGAPAKLRFTARVDHQDREVELDESELPALYQKAQATERAQRRLQELRGGRDLGAEAEELLAVFPQMQGRSIPTEVVLDSLNGKRSLTAAFAAYTERQHQAELSALKRDGELRGQNRRSSERAPVRGVSAGGGTEQKAADPFLIGFDSEGW